MIDWYGNYTIKGRNYNCTNSWQTSICQSFCKPWVCPTTLPHKNTSYWSSTDDQGSTATYMCLHLKRISLKSLKKCYFNFKQKTSILFERGCITNCYYSKRYYYSVLYYLYAPRLGGNLYNSSMLLHCLLTL